MALTFDILPISEGGFATLRIRLDRENGFDFDSGDRIDVQLTYQRPGVAGVLVGSSSYRKIDPFTLYMRGPAYDDVAVSGDGLARFVGSVTISGVKSSFDLSALVRDSDNADFTSNLADQRAAGRAISFGRLTDISSPDAGRTLVRQMLEPSYTPIPLMAYEFFTGRIPTLSGMAFLLGDLRSPTGLNGPYYERFNTENKYINFASNLGIYGEGAETFANTYGPLSMYDAIVLAYRTMIGPPNVGGVQAILGSASYFRAVARERIGGSDLELSAKAAMVGYVMYEAQKEHIGLYVQAVENYALDLSDGSARGGVDLIGTYGPGTFLDGYQAFQG